MSILSWLILLAVTFISFLPLTRLKTFNIGKKYRSFKYLSLYLFVWSIINILRMVVVNPYVLYYLALSVYPLIYVVTLLLIVAILRYLGKEIKKIFFWLGGILFLFEMFAVYTNPLHQLFVKLLPSASVTLEQVNNMDHGILFFIHMIICYFLLLVVFALILKKLYSNLKKEQDIMPFAVMLIGMIVGVTFNMIHVFSYSFIIDPTYVSFVLIVSLLYFVFYIRDIKLILEMGRNNFVLDNLREMYLIVNQRDQVVDASEELLKQFGIDITDNLDFTEVTRIMEQKAIIYEDQKAIADVPNNGKKFLHMLVKPINLPLFRYTGKLYLFFDQTINQKYINEMNYVKSHDLMTNLYNRNYFEEMKITIDDNYDLYTLVLLDLDGLKITNDYLGHSEGDNAIIEFANRLKQVSSLHDYITIRLGGDEFLLICLNKTEEQVYKEITDFTKSNPRKTEDIIYSYGISSKRNSKEKLEKIFNRADDLMYEMKIINAPRKDELRAKFKNQKKIK